MLYLFYGQETYNLGKEVAEHTEKEGVEVSVFENGNFDLLSSNMVTQSFFSQKQLFIVREQIGNIDDKTEEKILKSLQNLPESTDVIFIEKKNPVKSKIFDYIKKNGQVKFFEEPKNVNLVSFIKEKVAQEGGEITPLAAERLATFVGADLWQLSEEIRKLVLYTMGENETEAIDIADVDLLVKANFEAKIFSLMDALATKNTKRSSEFLDSFLTSGENEIYILTMIERQFKNIAMAKFEENASESALSGKAGLHPYVAKKSIQQSRNFEKSEIIEIYRKLADADLKLKSGFEPKQVLQRLII